MGAHRRHIIVRTTPRCVTGIIRRGRRGGGGIRGGCLQRIVESIVRGNKFIDFCFENRINGRKDTYYTWGFRFLLYRQVLRFSHDLFQVAETFLRTEAGDIQC